MSIADLAFEALEMTYPSYSSEIYFAIECEVTWRRIENLKTTVVSDFLLSSRKYVIRRAPLEAFALAVGEFPDSERLQFGPACAVLSGTGLDFDSLEEEILGTVIGWLKKEDGDYDGIPGLLEGLKGRTCSELLLFFGRTGTQGNEIWSGFCGLQRA